MIKAEKTIHEGKFNLVNTEIDSGLDEHYIRQLTKEEAIALLRSLLNVLI